MLPLLLPIAKEKGLTLWLTPYFIHLLMVGVRGLEPLTVY